MLLITSLLFITACNKEKNSNLFFVKQLNVKEDATTVWLRNNDNYNNSKIYFAVFYKYYNNKLTKKDFEGATRILDIVSTKLAFFYDFNKPFFATSEDFDTK